MSRMMLTFTIFLGSFLSFALEPMIGRTLLPVFGGTPSVWVTCLAAFQVLMVGGYWYAKCGVRGAECGVRRLHIALLVVSAVWCVAVALFRAPILSALSTPHSALPPALDVLVCVLALCGVTFVLLSANATVVQVLSGGDYRLYAVSNAGSLAGLLAYPLVFEPNVALTVQWYGLGAGIVAYAALLWRAARGTGAKDEKREDERRKTEDARVEDARRETEDGGRMALYLLIPAATCALLNAVTSHLTLDVAPLPLLWAILLALFLVSYIIGFSGKARLGLWIPLGAVAAVAAAFLDRPGQGFTGAGFVWQLVADAALVLCASTALHGYLYEIRPAKAGLPRYYLLNVVGGAVGGVLTSIVAPLAFDTVAEFPILVVVSCALLAFVAFAGKGVKPWLKAVALLSLAGSLWGVFDGHLSVDLHGRVAIHRARGFFGTVEVAESKARTRKSEGKLHEFIHGNTTHGIQVRMPGEWRTPTCYYTQEACGYAIVGHPKYRAGEPMRVNLVGLGAGVLFAYGRTNDYYRAYEISQDAYDVATNTNLFSFIADCPARKDIVVMDARKGLEAELAAGVEPYDVIVVDAFTGDNIPYHLSTKEAIGLYFRLLKPDGILCIHISNWHLSLEPYVRKIGDDFDSPLLGFYARGDTGRCSFETAVAFFCRQPDRMAPPPVAGGRVRLINFSEVPPMRELPTDEKGSFLSLINIP